MLATVFVVVITDIKNPLLWYKFMLTELVICSRDSFTHGSLRFPYFQLDKVVPNSVL